MPFTVLRAQRKHTLRKHSCAYAGSSGSMTKQIFHSAPKSAIILQHPVINKIIGTFVNFQHLEEGKNLPGDRNLYPLPVGSRMERAPGLLRVEIVGDGATFLGFEQWCPLEEFMVLSSSSRSSRLSWVSLGEQWRGERFKRLSTSLLADVKGPEALCTALIGPRCCCCWAEAFTQKVFRLCMA